MALIFPPAARSPQSCVVLCVTGATARVQAPDGSFLSSSLRALTFPLAPKPLRDLLRARGFLKAGGWIWKSHGPGASVPRWGDGGTGQGELVCPWWCHLLGLPVVKSPGSVKLDRLRIWKVRMFMWEPMQCTKEGLHDGPITWPGSLTSFGENCTSSPNLVPGEDLTKEREPGTRPLHSPKRNVLLSVLWWGVWPPIAVPFCVGLNAGNKPSLASLPLVSYLGHFGGHQCRLLLQRKKLSRVS